ncbi:MAG: NUDIX hydrolase [Agriterribacter sp.]
MAFKKPESLSRRREVDKERTHTPNYENIAVSVGCVLFGFEHSQLKVLLSKRNFELYKNRWTLPGEMLKGDEDLDAAVARIIENKTGLTNVFMEQVRTFGKVRRHPETRIIAVAYCSLINIKHHQLHINNNELHWHSVDTIKELAFDHNDILNACHSWLQRRMQEHPLGLNLLEKEFSLRDLQLLYENILGEKMDRRNFRKKFFNMDLLIDTGKMENNVPHRPGKLYSFNYEKYRTMKKKKWLGIDF